MEKQAKVIWAPRAKRQADLAIAYCLKHFGKQAALNFIDKLEKNCIRIKNNPLIGTIEETFADRDKEYRSLIEGHHKLYIPKKENVPYVSYCCGIVVKTPIN